MPSRKRRRVDSTWKARLDNWKANIPLLYDTIYHEKLDYCSYACAFGNVLEQHPYHSVHRLFFSRATNAEYVKTRHVWAGHPHALLVCNVHIPRQFTSYGVDTQRLINSLTYKPKSKYHKLVITKRIIHPGPVLRIKQMPQHGNVIATHTQHKYVFIWNTASQHDRLLKNNSDPNTPELILKGHKKEAMHALDFSKHSYHVVSGSKDARICIWGIQDYQTSLAADSPDNSAPFQPLSKPSPKLKPAVTLKGHSAEVSDVNFSPVHTSVVASVSYDRTLRLWDVRCGNSNDTSYNSEGLIVSSGNNSSGSCTQEMRQVHDNIITNMAWNQNDANYIITGCASGYIKLIDLRKPAVIHTFSGHSDKITSLSWHPSQRNSRHFLSTSNDGNVLIWDMNEYTTHRVEHFRHIGHMNDSTGPEKVHCAEWINSDDCWAVCSVSSPDIFQPTSLTTPAANADNKESSSLSDPSNPANTSAASATNTSSAMSISSVSSTKKSSDEMPFINEQPQRLKGLVQSGLIQIWMPSPFLRMTQSQILKKLRESKNILFSEGGTQSQLQSGASTVAKIDLTSATAVNPTAQPQTIAAVANNAATLPQLTVLGGNTTVTAVAPTTTVAAAAVAAQPFPTMPDDLMSTFLAANPAHSHQPTAPQTAAVHRPPTELGAIDVNETSDGAMVASGDLEASSVEGGTHLSDVVMTDNLISAEEVMLPPPPPQLSDSNATPMGTANVIYPNLNLGMD